VPPALLELTDRDVLVLEPRRLAARLAARFAAAERGEPVGETVGYHVRFEEIAGPRTRLRFLTEGVLLRRLLGDPFLERAGIVVLDEFHERHLEGDVSLALLRRLQRTARPDLRLVVMSATLDAAPVARYLSAPVLRCEARQHPLEVEYAPHSARPLEEQVAAALERLATRPNRGHVLVFLPGAAEIRRVLEACSGLARRHDWALLPLHGDLTAEEQDLAVSPSSRRKVILSTNVAESSITIDGVSMVIDSGLARIASHSPWSGLPVLHVARISQASAAQRAGRAGRTGPGFAIRLYPREDFVRRAAQDVPEILRADLSPVALLLESLGIGDFDALEWLYAPHAAGIEQAHDLLHRLGATGELAREMARYPLHPRLARLIVESRRRGVAEDGCTAAAILSAGVRLPAQPKHESESDVLMLMESEWDAHTERTVRQLRRIVQPPKQCGRDEDALLISILTAFPDRVARRRQGREVLLASGGGALLAPSSAVTSAEWLVAVDAEDRRDQKLPLIRAASGIRPEWLLDLFPDRMREVSELVWDRTAERVECVSSLLFEQIAIEQSRRRPEAPAAANLLARKAVEAGLHRFGGVEEIAALQARARFAGVREPDPEAALRSLATGLESFRELEEAAGKGGLRRAMVDQLTEPERRQLEAAAPESIHLPNGRRLRIHYENGQQPWIASRLQDFFGLRTSPTVRGGAVPLVVRLLAPNQRPIQTTTDLAGFWERLYPQVRRELMRRYPKHAWPENPSHSVGLRDKPQD
jgi:ATP-dependent helicase HrpB